MPSSALNFGRPWRQGVSSQDVVQPQRRQRGVTHLLPGLAGNGLPIDVVGEFHDFRYT